MKKIGVVHSVKTVCGFFDLFLKERIGNIEIYNLLDDWLSKQLQQNGTITWDIRKRFLLDLKHQEMLGVDAVVCTCSSLSRIVPEVRLDFSIPVLSIDEHMFDKLSDRNGKALMIATSYSAVEPVQNSIAQKMTEKGTNIAMSVLFLETAGAIMHKNGNMEEHDALVLEAVKKMGDNFDFIVFAQASLAHLKDRVETITGKQVYSGPDFCVAELKEVLR